MVSHIFHKASVFKGSLVGMLQGQSQQSSHYIIPLQSYSQEYYLALCLCALCAFDV